MGQRGPYQSACALVRAFVAKKEWRQSALAKHLGIGVPALRKNLEALRAGGMPLKRSEEPPQVYWCVPNGWLPVGLNVSAEELPVLSETLLGLPAGKHRDALLRRLLQGHPKELASFDQSVQLASQPVDETLRSALLQAAAKKYALRVRYFTSSKGVEGMRTLSVQKTVPSPRPRVVAFCHRSQELRWFRTDQFLSVAETREAYVQVAPPELEKFLSTSVDGFREPDAGLLAFKVPYPAAGWIKNHLPAGMQVDEQNSTSESVRVIAPGGALMAARFITSLGGLAVAEGNALGDLVRETAKGALAAHATANAQTPQRSPGLRKGKGERAVTARASTTGRQKAR